MDWQGVKELLLWSKMNHPVEWASKHVGSVLVIAQHSLVWIGCYFV